MVYNCVISDIVNKRKSKKTTTTKQFSLSLLLRVKKHSHLRYNLRCSFALDPQHSLVDSDVVTLYSLWMGKKTCTGKANERG